jgi:RNA polymerase sigma-70 factor (ECF subfamily)
VSGEGKEDGGPGGGAGASWSRHAADAARAAALAALAADRARFTAFVRRRLGAGRGGGAAAEADDLVQQAFARAVEKIGDLRDPARAAAWFYRLLRRLVAGHHAGRALRARRLADLAPALDTATPGEAAPCGCALGVLDRLPPTYAEMLRRVDLDDEPIAAVAAREGISVNNATVRLHRARHRLRDEVESLCGPGVRRARQACADCACAAPPA